MDIIPAQTRYLPIRQMPYCCVPACLQMVMYRKDIKLVPQEHIGYELGLTVPPESAHNFYNVRTAPTPPAKSGFGTQIQNEEFNLPTALKRLGVPIQFTFLGADKFESVEDFENQLQALLSADQDVLVCLHVGTWEADPARDYGHVMVVDSLRNGIVHLVNSDLRDGNHWPTAPLEVIFKAIKHHTAANMGGLWWLKGIEDV